MCGLFVIHSFCCPARVRGSLGEFVHSLVSKWTENKGEHVFAVASLNRHSDRLICVCVCVCVAGVLRLSDQSWLSSDRKEEGIRRSRFRCRYCAENGDEASWNPWSISWASEGEDQVRASLTNLSRLRLRLDGGCVGVWTLRGDHLLMVDVNFRVGIMYLLGNLWFVLVITLLFKVSKMGN